MPMSELFREVQLPVTLEKGLPVVVIVVIVVVVGIIDQQKRAGGM